MNSYQNERNLPDFLCLPVGYYTSGQTSHDKTVVVLGAENSDKGSVRALVFAARAAIEKLRSFCGGLRLRTRPLSSLNIRGVSFVFARATVTPDPYQRGVNTFRLRHSSRYRKA